MTAEVPSPYRDASSGPMPCVGTCYGVVNADAWHSTRAHRADSACASPSAGRLPPARADTARPPLRHVAASRLQVPDDAGIVRDALEGGGAASLPWTQGWLQ
eukprot:7380616-Prymnesium_polylepis.1